MTAAAAGLFLHQEMFGQRWELTNRLSGLGLLFASQTQAKRKQSCPVRSPPGWGALSLRRFRAVKYLLRL